MNPHSRALSAFPALAFLLTLSFPGIAGADDWNAYRVVPEAMTWPEDLEDFTLVAISGDASVISGNEVADWNLFPNEGPLEFRNQYPFFWAEGMEHVREIAPNTDGIILFSNGYRGRVTGISRDGKWVVGEYAFANSNRHQAFLYDVENDLFEYLGDFGWTWLEIHAPEKYLASVATGVSGDGSVVVGWARDTEGRQKGFRWTREEGMVMVFHQLIGFWDDQPEDRILAISDDGTRFVAEGTRLRKPNDTERVSTVLVMDHSRFTSVFPMPHTFSLNGSVEVSGPDNSVLLTIRSAFDPLLAASRFSPSFESTGVRWFPAQDRYEAYAEFAYSRVLSALSQSDDGSLMTLLMTGIAPTDGTAHYGLLWSPGTGLMEATSFLANTWEVDFGPAAVAKVLPARDKSMLVAEVYTTGGHFRKTLARFDISGEPAPMAQLFPESSYHNGWRSTSMGRFFSEGFPHLWWDNMGWVFLDTAASSSEEIWFWHSDLGWCYCAPDPRQLRFYFYSTKDAEWVYAFPLQGWLHSPSRSWFRLLD